LDQPLYPTFAEVVAFHNEIVEDGHLPRSPPLHPDKLESAIGRPRNHAFYSPWTDLALLAAILAAAISQSQAFEDGNKRTALAVADAFLVKNGWNLTADSEISSCWLICIAGNINNENHDLENCCKHLGLDLVAELDFMSSSGQREAVVELFAAWIRLNVSPLGPEGLIPIE
jgi:death-on-curing protein